MSREKDENLMIISTVEELGLRYGLPSEKIYDVLMKNGIFPVIRSQYEVLHTLSLEESADFAESMLKTRGIEL